MERFGHKVIRKCGLPPSAWHYIPGRAYISHQAYTYCVRGYAMHRMMLRETFMHLAPIFVAVGLAIVILWLRQQFPRSSSPSHSSPSSSLHPPPPRPFLATLGDSDHNEDDSVSPGFSISSLKPVDEAKYRALFLNPDLEAMMAKQILHKHVRLFHTPPTNHDGSY